MNIRDYLTVLRENKLVIAGCLLTCLVIAVLVTVLAPRSYASTSSYFVTTTAATPQQQPQQNGATDLYQGAQLAQDRVKSYTELITGPRVAADAAAALGGGLTADDVASRVEVTSEENSVIFEVSATGSTPQDAARLLTAVSNSFLAVVRQVEDQPVDASRVVTQVVQQPSLPTTPQFPKPALNLAIGALLGLVIGFGVAVLRRSTDVTIRSADDLEYAAGADVFGAVPERAGGAVTLPVTGSGREAEAFRRIRTNVEFLNFTRGRRVIILTSALPGEGTTTAACNLAAALSAVGARVVLVDGNVRRPRVPEALGWEAGAGLTEVVAGEVALDRALITGTAVGFDVLPAGQTPARPNEMLSSRRTHATITELKGRYDYVLIDTPSLLSVGDAVNLGSHADGAVVVCRYGHVGGPDVTTAVSYLHAVAVPVLGTILNRVPERSRDRRVQAETRVETRVETPAPVLEQPPVARTYPGLLPQPRPTATPAARPAVPAETPAPAREVPVQRAADQVPSGSTGVEEPAAGTEAGSEQADQPTPAAEQETASPAGRATPTPRPHPVQTPNPIDPPTQRLESVTKVEEPANGS